MLAASAICYGVIVINNQMKLREKAIVLALGTVFYSLSFAIMFYYLETPAFIILGTIATFFGIYIYFGI